MVSTRWTDEEVKLLKDLYPSTRVKDMTFRFPNRNKNTIVAKALSLKLASAKLWQPHENQLMRANFVNSPKCKLLELLPKRTWVSIVAQGERLGLRRKTDKPKLPINEAYFEQWSSNMAYVLGFILADGCIIQGTYKGYSDTLKFGVQLKDQDILEKIKSEFKSDHTISIFKNAAHFCITSQKIVNDLKNLKVTYRKSLREKIPSVPDIYIKDFIRGIVDGDGSIKIDQKGYPALTVCGGEATIKFIQEYFSRLFRLHPKLYKRVYSKGDLYEVAYRCNSALKVIFFLYNDANLYLNRKYQLSQKCLKLNIKSRENSYFNHKEIEGAQIQ